MKSVRIWSYSGIYFPAFGQNTDQNNSEYGHFLRGDLVLEKLRNSTHDLFKRFKENHVKANPDKYQLLVTTNALTSVYINGFQITNNIEEKLLSTEFDSKLSFETMSQASVRMQVKNYMH